MTSSVAIVGLACLYPEARTPAQLWENVLAQRRAFRRIPDERLRRDDYFAADPLVPDRTYTANAAVIEGYEFDRVAFKVVGSTYRSADLAHWLALDIASQALGDAGFADGAGLPREATGVVLGNTLTGEFSRANLMRLRWPYVRRVLEASLQEQGWAGEKRAEFLEALEVRYKSPFPPVGEETLAGGLSNTIAGRICNQFDLKGGGYTVDGACASSLLAVANACSSLVAGDLDVALAGGVDLSLDPFEIIGFAKTRALAPELMRVFDARSAGFWPGEGCGFTVLMRHEDAVARGCRIYATVRGWGISSDGAGGITRPEVDGQLQAIRRAYRRAGYGIDTVEYFEGHGTGTHVGDATELKVISTARRQSQADAAPAVIGSIKANIGHTKAAAGMAGFIKATLAVHTQTLPPMTGSEHPHPELAATDAVLRILREPQPWRGDRPLRAAVSAMGFGGMNAHVTIENATVERRSGLSSRDRALGASAQDCELFLLAGGDADALLKQVGHLLTFAARLSFSELADVAAELASAVAGRPVALHKHRAALIASTPGQFAERLAVLHAWLLDGATAKLEFDAGIFLGGGRPAPRIGFLFPGQGSPAHTTGGLFLRRFDSVRELYAAAHLPAESDGVSTAIAQPAIATATTAGVKLLRSFGIDAAVGVGHSLGEICALHWAGAFDEAALLRVARERGRAMAELGSPTGAMAALAAPAHEVTPLLGREAVSIVGFNSPHQTVIAGEAAAVNRVVAVAQARGWRATRLPVSHAFHTPLVAAATPVLAAQLAHETMAPPVRRVVSTITGSTLAAHEDLRDLLCRQVTAPVKFIDALKAAGPGVDLWIEVGPGEVLGGLARDTVTTPVLAIDAGGESLRGLWQAVAAAYALGAPVDADALFAGRITRPFSLDWQPKFFVSPCELAPVTEGGSRREEAPPEIPEQAPGGMGSTASPLDLIRQLVAERAELPAASVTGESRLLGDLHLNSISVGQVMAEAAKRLGLPPLIGLTDFATATVGRAAAALEELTRNRGAVIDESMRLPSGVDSWVRPFVFEWVETLPAPRIAESGYSTARQHADSLVRAPAWQVFGPESHPLAAPVRAALAAWTGPGVLVLLPAQVDETPISLLLDSARAALAAGEGKFVLVQCGQCAGSFVRTLHLEAPRLHTLVLELPAGHPRSLEWILNEAEHGRGHRDVRYDDSGRRYELVMKHLPLPTRAGELPLSNEDVLLVTGGGKGIAAECALHLARASGARLLLMGRSRPADDVELAANLERFAAAKVSVRYLVADVTDPAAVQSALAEGQRESGPVTAFIHAAGANVPQLISSLDEDAFRRTLAPKVDGARHVLAALDAERLRLFVTFGSIIGRAGLPGEADYAVANERLTQLTEDFQAAHPRCRCLAAEWSVWSGVGMGARLGRIEGLRQQGMTPISPEVGVAILEELLRHELPAVSVVIAGRLGELPTLTLAKPELPFRRFLEHTRVFYPGVELIVDSTLSSDSDPYVDEHVFHGEPLFPAVMGLEAMAQVAMALADSVEPPSFADVELARPVVVPRGGKNTIRVAALVREPGVIEVVLRCEQTGFQADHFRAVCRFDDAAQSLPAGAGQSPDSDDLAATVALDPTRDLYDRLLFHTGRFRRVLNYRLLNARECAVQLAPYVGPDWFARYLPQERVLGCGAVRDAAIHAIQACIPHARLLPIGVRRIVVGQVPCRLDQWRGEGCLPELILHAREIQRDGDTFEYDLELTGPGGAVLEAWQGLRLRKVEELSGGPAWPEGLLGPYVERRLEELVPGARISVSAGRGASSEAGVRVLLGSDATLHHRADGRPEVAGPNRVSLAHAGGLTLAVSSTASVGCDMEAISPRPPETWRGLLGAEHFRLAELIARHEDLDTAATRVWAAMECLKKSGAMSDAPLTLVDRQPDGWVTMHSGPRTVATGIATVGAASGPMVIGVLAGSAN